MATLVYISAASVIGGVLSICVAAAVSFAARAHWVSALISFAIGALLGAAFLEVLPHAFGNAADLQAVSATVLAGILGFFVLEKLVLWRHTHAHDIEVDRRPAEHDHGRSGMLILVGDSFHNFVDGILIAAAFLQSPELGLITAIAIVAHEIPQEVGDFLVLLHSGYSKAKAFAMNLLSSGGTLVGGVLGYFTLQGFEHWEPILLGIVAASMIYVAVADLIPGLHKRPELRATAAQAVLIAAGVAVIALVRVLVSNGH